MATYGFISAEFIRLPWYISRLQDFLISCNRINSYLISEELTTNYITWKSENDPMEPVAIEIKNGNFFWVHPDVTEYVARTKQYEENLKAKKCCRNVRIPTKGEKNINKTNSSETTKNDLEIAASDTNLKNLEIDLDEEYKLNLNLKNINLEIKKGSLVALIGKIGSGKSSLISSLFGELYEYHGTDKTNFNKSPQVYMNGSVSYVPQTSWIKSCSIKDNILFNTPYNEKRYKEVIHYAALEKD